jgi:hypothetical protein
MRHQRGTNPQTFLPSALPPGARVGDLFRAVVFDASESCDLNRLQQEQIHRDAARHRDQFYASAWPPYLTVNNPITNDLIEQERVETMNLLAMCADRVITMVEAVAATDAITAVVRGVDAYIPMMSHVGELWARRLLATKGSGELLELRHNNAADVPIGLKQLVAQLGRDRQHESQFFPSGGSSSSLAPLQQTFPAYRTTPPFSAADPMFPLTPLPALPAPSYTTLTAPPVPGRVQPPAPQQQHPAPAQPPSEQPPQPPAQQPTQSTQPATYIYVNSSGSLVQQGRGGGV